MSPSSSQKKSNSLSSLPSAPSSLHPSSPSSAAPQAPAAVSSPQLIAETILEVEGQFDERADEDKDKHKENTQKTAKELASWKSTAEKILQLEKKAKIAFNIMVEDLSKPRYGPTPSSVSSLSVADLVTKDKMLQRGFDCPVCKKILREPILTCGEGHSFCHRCVKFVKSDNPDPALVFVVAGFVVDAKCPVRDACTLPMPAVRNSALETVIRDLELPVSCEQHKNGCDFTTVLREVDSHEKRCPYQPIKCGVMGCAEVILVNKVEEHWRARHRDWLLVNEGEGRLEFWSKNWAGSKED